MVYHIHSNLTIMMLYHTIVYILASFIPDDEIWWWFTGLPHHYSILICLFPLPPGIKHGLLEKSRFCSMIFLAASISFGDFWASHVWFSEGSHMNMVTMLNDA